MTVVRPVRAGDAQTVAALCNQLGYPTTPDFVSSGLSELMPDPDHVVLVACREGTDQVVGFIHGYRRRTLLRAPHVEIAALVVAEGYRGRGAGAQLLGAVEQWSAHRGLAEIMLRANVKRLEAHRFYERQGMVIEKRSTVFTKRVDATGTGA